MWTQLLGGLHFPLMYSRKWSISLREHLLGNARKHLPQKLLASIFILVTHLPRATPCGREVRHADQLKPASIHPGSGDVISFSNTGAAWGWGEDPDSICILLLGWRQIATKWDFISCNNVKYFTEYLLCDRYCAMLFLIYSASLLSRLVFSEVLLWAECWATIEEKWSHCHM